MEWRRVIASPRRRRSGVFHAKSMPKRVKSVEKGENRAQNRSREPKNEPRGRGDDHDGGGPRTEGQLRPQRRVHAAVHAGENEARRWLRHEDRPPTYNSSHLTSFKNSMHNV